MRKILSSRVCVSFKNSLTQSLNHYHGGSQIQTISYIRVHVKFTPANNNDYRNLHGFLYFYTNYWSHVRYRETGKYFSPLPIKPIILNCSQNNLTHIVTTTRLFIQNSPHHVVAIQVGVKN